MLHANIMWQAEAYVVALRQYAASAAESADAASAASVHAAAMQQHTLARLAEHTIQEQTIPSQKEAKSLKRRADEAFSKLTEFTRIFENKCRQEGWNQTHLLYEMTRPGRTITKQELDTFNNKLSDLFEYEQASQQEVHEHIHLTRSNQAIKLEELFVQDGEPTDPWFRDPPRVMDMFTKSGYAGILQDDARYQGIPIRLINFLRGQQTRGIDNYFAPQFSYYGKYGFVPTNTRPEVVETRKQVSEALLVLYEQDKNPLDAAINTIDETRHLTQLFQTLDVTPELEQHTLRAGRRSPEDTS